MRPDRGQTSGSTGLRSSTWPPCKPDAFFAANTFQVKNTTNLSKDNLLTVLEAVTFFTCRSHACVADQTSVVTCASDHLRYRCPRRTCVGGAGDVNWLKINNYSNFRQWVIRSAAAKGEGGVQASFSTTPAVECWERVAYLNGTNSYTVCSGGTASDELQCSEGAGGPLCGSCLSKYTYSSTERDCQVVTTTLL